MPTQYEWFNCNECYDGQCYDCEIKQEELDKQIAKEEKEKKKKSKAKRKKQSRKRRRKSKKQKKKRKTKRKRN